MFSRQKLNTDIKKSTIKFLDSKKDVPTRLKHLKLILDSIDISEAKTLFATNYSHIYHLVYEGILCAEKEIKIRGVHRSQREELESVLHLLEKIITLLPDLLHCRWQVHSMGRIMQKLNHVGNSIALRRQGMRLFILYYQTLSNSSPSYIHAMFSSLIPGLTTPTTITTTQSPTTPIPSTPILPSPTTEKEKEDQTSYFLELLLDYLVSQAPKIHWNNEINQMWSKSIEFLFERFKEFYLERIFGGFKITNDVYSNLVLDLPEPRKSADCSNNTISSCQVVFVKWIANYAHSVYKSDSVGWQTTPQLTTTPPSSLDYSITSYSSVNNDVDANVLAKEIILGSRENINFLHEIFRRALLMNFVHTIAIRRVICVYKDWIQINVPELPIFMLEPTELNNTDLKAGSQKILQLFFSNSSSVFLLFQIPKHEAAMAFLEEQVDICKRVLNIYRYAVMNTRMGEETWSQLLLVLLHITSKVLDPKQTHFGIKNPDSLGSKLASALFQTLIVSWVKASLNVHISIQLWDRFHDVLVQLSFCDDLVTEWAKTMETLTRVLSRHVYNLDLSNLPLDRLSEQKSKKNRTKKVNNKTEIILPPLTPTIKKIKKSLSDSNLDHTHSTIALKKSQSMTCIKINVVHVGMDWGEISSSAVSLDVAAVDQDDKTPMKGVISGGEIKGWLPSVAAILWRRMLGILGNVNEFSNPKTHAHFFQVLLNIYGTLCKVRSNQGVTLDNMSTPKPTELCPPLIFFANWCFQSLELHNDDYYKGKITACSLLIDITITNQDIKLSQEYLTKFYSTIHKLIISNQPEIINEIVKKYKISKMLPGSSLLLLDLSQASHSVLMSEELRGPRPEAASTLGSILTISSINLPILKPNSNQFQPISSHQTKDVVLSCLMQFSKTEKTSHARVICLQSLTIFICKELIEIRFGKKKKIFLEIFDVLIASVGLANRTVALVASDLLLLISEFATEISNNFPEVVKKILMGLTKSLKTALPLKNSSWKTGKPVETEKRLLISLMLTIGEWCMKIPIKMMLCGGLLEGVFEVLTMCVRGFNNNDKGKGEEFLLLEGFDTSVPFDDLQKPDNQSQTSPSQDLETVRLAAKTLLKHLMTQTYHFPITTNGSARCSSIVSENDDLQKDELSNVQIFSLNQDTLLSIIELPPITDLSTPQVRIILRDLTGKSCWDGTHLEGDVFDEQSINQLIIQKNQQVFEEFSTMNFLPQQLGLTVRRRTAGILPSFLNSADDLDNLDDLLTYIAHTSPECLQKPGHPLNIPNRPPNTITQENEDDVVGSVVNQRNAELEFLVKFDGDVTMKAPPATATTTPPTSELNFLLSRRLFSQLGFIDKRQNIDVLVRDEKLLRELRHLDGQKCRETHKIAVIYVAEGQEDKNSILSNNGGSEDYEDFVAGLGWEIDLETHTGFMGGLNRNKSTGETAPYYATSFTEVIFHVATRMPSNSDESLLQKTRHLGNDEVHIVWSEHKRDYRRDIIPTEFCDVLVVIYPLEFGLFRIQICRKGEVPYFGPLYNEVVVDRDVLPLLVRASAINASRAKRSSLQFFEHHFEERSKSLATIIKNHKSKTTFEGFAANVFSPVIQASQSTDSITSWRKTPEPSSGRSSLIDSPLLTKLVKTRHQTPPSSPLPVFLGKSINK